MNTSLAKKTKAELISAYEALLATQKQLEGATRQSYAEEKVKVVERAEKEHTVDAVQKTVESLRGVSSASITQFAQIYEAQVRRFEELQKASALLEERVKVLRELEAGAEMGTQLLSALESERAQLEQEIETKKRDWERAQEETEYRTTLMRKREEEAVIEERRKKDLVLKEREHAVAIKEKEVAEQVKRLETFDVELEKEVGKRVVEAKKAWDSECVRELAEKDRERELEEKLHELEVKSLREDVKRLEAESAVLRKDAEQANKRAQDLALKIVEGGARERVVSTGLEK
jgi:hypothetical protein